MPTNLEERRYKSSVARHFGRAAHTYNEFADFQSIVVQELQAFLPHDVNKGAILVDLGAGTGSSTLALKKRFGEDSDILSLDISVDMLKKLREGKASSELCCADFEQLPFKPSVVDVFFSSLAIQWCISIEKLLGEVQEALVEKGEFVFSTLLPGSMVELEQAWLSVDELQHVNHYHSEDYLFESIAKSGFEVVSHETKCITMYFPDVKGVLYSLKKVGASFVVEGQKNVMSKSKWKRFLAAYEKLRDPKGIPLSYQVMFARIRKNRV